MDKITPDVQGIVSYTYSSDVAHSSIDAFRIRSFRLLPNPTMFVYALPLMVLAAQAALTYKGVDWSSLLVEEAAGQTYKNSAGAVQPLETILKASGVNTVRQRLWVRNGNYDLAYNLKLAKRARAAGLNVYLDFHFSDSWVRIVPY